MNLFKAVFDENFDRIFEIKDEIDREYLINENKIVNFQEIANKFERNSSLYYFILSLDPSLETFRKDRFLIVSMQLGYILANIFLIIGESDKSKKLEYLMKFFKNFRNHPNFENIFKNYVQKKTELDIIHILDSYAAIR